MGSASEQSAVLKPRPSNLNLKVSDSYSFQFIEDAQHHLSSDWDKPIAVQMFLKRNNQVVMD